MTELEAAGISLKSQMWLERLRKADYTNGYNGINPSNAREIARQIDAFLDAYLADLDARAQQEAEDAEVATPERLQELGYEIQFNAIEYKIRSLKLSIVADVPEHPVANGLKWYFNGYRLWEGKVVTMGDVRRLIGALEGK